MFSFIGIFGLFMLVAPLAVAPPLPFLLDVPVLNATFLVAGVLFLAGFSRFDLVRKNSQTILFITASVFTIYLSYGLFVQQFASALTYYFWLYVIIGGSCFNKIRNVFAFFSLSLISTTIVIICLPESKAPFHFWSFLLFAIPLMFVFFLLVSRSIYAHEHLNRSKNALQRKSDELDTVFNTLKAMVGYKDEHNRFYKMNTSLAKFFHLDGKKGAGVSLYDVLPYEIAKHSHEEDLAIIRTGRPMLNKTEKIPTRDGKGNIWLRTNKSPAYDDAGNITGIVVSSEDVTEQVKSEQRIRESEERFRMIFDFAPDGMSLVDFKTGRFIKTNLAFQEMHGYTEREFKELTTQDLTHPDDVEMARNAMLDAIKNGQDYYSIEKRNFHKSGGMVFCSVDVHILKESGRPKFLIGVIKDISQRKENEKRLERYALQLEESNRNLQEFAYAASHDLREPLRTVVSYVQLLKKKMPAHAMNKDTHDFMDFIVSGSKRMESQIAALLDYSRVSRGELKLQRTDLNQTVFNVCNSLKSQMKENGASIEIGHLPEIMADAHQMDVLMQNLISNSIKYRRGDDAPLVRISSKKQETDWLFSVTDNGIGMEKGYLEKIFAVFRRLHSQEEIPGTGIGLTICRRILQRHGGKIWAESKPGVGTTFFFTIPFKKENLPTQPYPPAFAIN